MNRDDLPGELYRKVGELEGRVESTERLVHENQKVTDENRLLVRETRDGIKLVHTDLQKITAKISALFSGISPETANSVIKNIDSIRRLARLILWIIASPVALAFTLEAINQVRRMLGD